MPGGVSMTALRFLHMLRSLLRVVALLLLLGSASPTAAAQVTSLSDSARISMITILPGDRIYTEFGHSALRVQDPAHDFDALYSYGTFDFDDPLFVPKFTYGRLTYFLSVAHYPGMLRHYRRYGRPVIEQHLNLTPNQQQALFRFLQTNARPENRYYQYDFLFDNCSTRIRDALETTLNDDVQFAPRPDLNRSFRELLDPYVADRPLLDLGFDLALGTPSDAIATPYQSMFLPEHLLTAFNHATVTTAGTTQPLVTRTDTVLWVEGYDATESAFPWTIAVTWLLLLGTLAWTGWQAMQNHPPGTAADATVLSLTGTAGLVLCFLWFISEHTVTDWNWNLAWAWPTHLGAAVLLVRSQTHRHLTHYLGITAVLMLALGLGWAWWPQNLHPALQPLVLALAVRAGWQAHVRSNTASGREIHPTP